MVHDARFAPPRSLESAIAANRRRTAQRNKYRRVCVRLCARHYDYIDAGLGEKAARVLAKARAIVKGTLQANRS